MRGVSKETFYLITRTHTSHAWNDEKPLMSLFFHPTAAQIAENTSVRQKSQLQDEKNKPDEKITAEWNERPFANVGNNWRVW